MSSHIISYFEKTKLDGTHIKFRIQEMRDQDKAEVIKFVEQFFIPYEGYVCASGVSTTPEATKELSTFLQGLLEVERCAPLLSCIDHEDPDKLEIVGCNLFMHIKKQQEPLPHISTDECKILFRVGEEFAKLYDVLENNGVDECLGGAGLSVHPNYTGCGIATELLKARRILIKRRGFPITCAWFTSFGSQRAALKAGFEVKTEITQGELAKLIGFKYGNVAATSQFMVATPKSD